MKKFISLLILTFSGCGYQLQGSGTILPPDVKLIAIPLAENETAEPQLGERLTEALRSRFDRYGAVKVTSSISAADAVLKTRVVDFVTNVRGVQGNTDTAIESDLVMTVDLELKKKNGQILYKNPKMVVSKPVAEVGNAVITGGSDFAQGGLSDGSIQALSAGSSEREVQRGQADQVTDDLVEEVARKAYLDAVAPDF